MSPTNKEEWDKTRKSRKWSECRKTLPTTTTLIEALVTEYIYSKNKKVLNNLKLYVFAGLMIDALRYVFLTKEDNKAKERLK